tara:strand:+ start:595 stop:1023 length:429 start_codon:yes stop_codon:yes gene_type:complete
MARKPPSERFLPSREKQGFGQDSDGGGVADKREEKDGTNPQDPDDDLQRGKTKTRSFKTPGTRSFGEGPKQPKGKRDKKSGKPVQVKTAWREISVSGLPEQVAPRAKKALLDSIPAQKAPRKSSKGIAFADQFPGHPRSKKR